jgi:hypothetical protein
MSVDKLAAWRDAGEDFAGALENAAIGGNQGLFLPNRPQQRTAAPVSFKQTDAEAGMARWEEMTGQIHPDRRQGGRASKTVIDITPRFKELG